MVHMVAEIIFRKRVSTNEKQLQSAGLYVSPCFMVIAMQVVTYTALYMYSALHKGLHASMQAIKRACKVRPHIGRTHRLTMQGR